tara:strand:+ start:5380 stop:6942 length:1563 start_codon:yes stop_codon:yes gene_type:complete
MIKKRNNIYLDEIYANLPRMLSLYNNDQLSPFYGVGDRDFWGWKTKDFINGTYQGITHGLSLLIMNDLLPDYLERSYVIELIDRVFNGTKSITRKDGSLEEAYPFEKSFCVTSLIAYDLTETIINLKPEISIQKYQYYLSVVEPLINFTINNNEHHGIISNHLASAAAALISWEKLSGASMPKAKELINQILKHQSEEGWFKEYSGADIGYQTLASSYLSSYEKRHPSAKLNSFLKKSFEFLSNFIHPDGGIGGIYGARNTEFYFPDGFEYFANKDNNAKAISFFMRESIKEKKCVNLSSVDAPNLIPMFNSYCRAALLNMHNSLDETYQLLPCQKNKTVFIFYEDAGFVVYNDANKYCVISTNKGGALYIFDKKLKYSKYDFGALYQNTRHNERYFSTQANETAAVVKVDYDKKIIEVICPLYEYKKMYPTPLKYILLRCLNLTLMRFHFLNEIMKKILVRCVIKSKSAPIGLNRRIISFSERIKINDEYEGKHLSLILVKDYNLFYSIHMASQSYWKR